jgi:methionyl-tRNA formyltransferase
MRILMLGTGPFAVPTFRWLLDSGHEVPALVTRPPRAGRGGKVEPAGPMQQVAAERGLPVLAPESINSPQAHAALRELRPELLVVCDYGQILSSETLSLAPLGGINLHGSLLPKYRGAAPIQWAIYHGETETGVSVIHMTPRLDGGPIIAVRRTPIGPRETNEELEPRLAMLGVEAVREAIDLLARARPGEALGEPQDVSQATKAPRLSKTQGLVDWSRTDMQIVNQVRAFKPWPASYTHWIRATESPRIILDEVSAADSTTPDTANPGEVVLVDKNRLLVATGLGLLSIDRVQPAGKKSMPVAEWLRGQTLKVGDRFGEALPAP